MKEFLASLIVRYFELFIRGWVNKLFCIFKSGLLSESYSRKTFLLWCLKKAGYVMCRLRLL